MKNFNWYKVFRYPFNIYGVQTGWMNIRHGFQRMFRGYDDTAYWGLNSYLTDIVLPVLKRYRKNKVGIPMIDGFTGDGDFEQMKVTWNGMVDKMIRAFQIMYDADHGLLPGNRWATDEENKEIDEGLAIFAKYFHNLWD